MLTNYPFNFFSTNNVVVSSQQSITPEQINQINILLRNAVQCDQAHIDVKYKQEGLYDVIIHHGHNPVNYEYVNNVLKREMLEGILSAIQELPEIYPGLQCKISYSSNDYECYSIILG